VNRIHTAIISYIREATIQEPLFAGFASLTDEQMVRQMFSNYRHGKGLRLSNFGLEVMRRHFMSYVIKVPDDEQLRPKHLLFLDANARMPYHCGKDEIVVYDHLLGVKLRLVNGRLSILVDVS
jgi:hypothetical protein